MDIGVKLEPLPSVTRRHLCFIFPTTTKTNKKQPIMWQTDKFRKSLVFGSFFRLPSFPFPICLRANLDFWIICYFWWKSEVECDLAQNLGIISVFWGKSEVECDLAETRPLRQSHNSHIWAGRGKGRPWLSFYCSPKFHPLPSFLQSP